jgi:hypothetical protein
VSFGPAPVTRAVCGCHKRGMTEPTTSTYPYTLDVEPNPRAKDTWQWAIRKHDKLVQRSDRAQPSEAKARSQGTETIQKLLHGGGEGRF